MKAVQRVIKPKLVVMTAKKIGGPTNLMTTVAGSWKQIEETVNMKIAIEYRSPVKDKSESIDVTAAEDMMPLSKRFKLHSKPAIEQSRISTFRRI